MALDLNRRDLLKLFSVAGFAAPLALPAPEPGAPLFFTKDEFDLLDTLTEIIIPADDHSPGAHEAGVAVYIDKSVAEAFLPEDKTSWRKGLASVNQLSHSMHGKPFLKTSKDQQLAVLKKMSSREEAKQPNKDDDANVNRRRTRHEQFFGQLKNTTVFAYYSSSIGIHKEIDYKGNVLLDKFVGYMPDEPLPPISSLTSSS
jgi:Gluconate 2-dehydrogenase subunit 3